MSAPVVRRLLASADTLCRVFGRPSEANSLGSLGRLVFRTVLQVNDYLQSVSAEAKSRRTTGADFPQTLSPCRHPAITGIKSRDKSRGLALLVP